jgi:hypothetical protein
MNGVRNLTAAIAMSGLIGLAEKPSVAYAHDIPLAQQTVETDRLKFNLLNCLRSGVAVTCNILATNTSNKDLGFQFSNSPLSRVIDFSGNEYKAVTYQAGQNGVSVSLTPDVPTRVKVKFELPVEVAALKVLSVYYYYGDYAPKKVDFRDIALTAAKR